MRIIYNSIFKKLYRPAPDSHKGQNGRLLVIAGSKKFHGALLLCIQTASRMVDMVYVYSTFENLELVKKLKSKIAVYINVLPKELWAMVDLVDAVIVGPGLVESKANIKLVEKLLKKYPDKKIIIDATALWHVNPNLLHKNCVVTPHSREFQNVFKCQPTAKNAQKMAKKYGCIIVLKGRYDYISDGKELWENKTGNVDMTKGGSGDVVAGLISSLATKNDLLLAAQAGIHLAGLVGDSLYKKSGTFYNAEDLIGELRKVWSKLG